MGTSPPPALVKRNSDSAMMPPPPPPKRQKRPAKVLDEDTYSNALSHIIARDFFPGLIETEAQSEYITALESKNDDWIRQAGRKLTQVMTPTPGGHRRGGRGTSFTPRRSRMQSETPRHFAGDTPQRTPMAATNNDFAPEEPPEVDLSLSLGAFQAKYTSEDNESFNTLLDKQNEKHAAKYEFFHQTKQIPTARQIAYREKERLLLESGESSTMTVTIDAAGEERRVRSASRPSQDLDARPASVDGFLDRQGPKNPLMFGPDGVEDLLVTHSQHAEMMSNAPPKAVKYSATRFHDKPEPEAIIPPSPSISAIDAAIAGRSKPTASEPGYSGSETPRVNGYAFVDEEPTPSELGIPVTDQEADAAQYEAAKQFLPKVDENGPSQFSIAERSKREALHYKLVEKADASRRKGGRVEQLQNFGITSGRTPTPKSLSSPSVRKSVSMTPAAKLLAEKIGTPRKKTMAFGSTGKRSVNAGSWTPTLRIK